MTGKGPMRWPICFTDSGTLLAYARVLCGHRSVVTAQGGARVRRRHETETLTEASMEEQY